MTLGHAIAVFAHRFAFTRSLISPCVALCIDPDIWVVRDDPPDRCRARGEQYIGCGASAAAVDETARRNARGSYCICAMARNAEADGKLREEFRALDYRLGTTEPLMVHDLREIANVPEPLPIVRIATSEQAAALGKAKRRRLQSLELLNGDPPPMPQYAVFDSEIAVGWVGSVAVQDCAWVPDVFVDSKYRRRGIARALLTQMLRDDRASGAEASVLLASHAGAKLYPTVGYAQIGVLLVYTPK